MADQFENLMTVIDCIMDKYLENGAKSLGEPELVLQSIWMLEAEVNNGGFHQFFFNSAGDLAAETVASLRKVGAPKTADIVQAANDNFGRFGPPKDRNERQNILEQLEEDGVLKLDSLDSEFYSYPHDLEGLMYIYAQHHGLLQNI